MTHILIIALEASGDLHGAAVLNALKQRLPHPIEAYGIGGPLLRTAGLNALARSEDLSAMGITDVLHHIPRLLALRRRILNDARRPKLAILCDAPDFNLPLGKSLRRRGVPVTMLVAPQAWAWRSGRARSMATQIDLLLTLFPFEVPFFRGFGVPTEFVGHPLASIATPRTQPTALALLPGSRPAELRRHLPEMLAAAQQLKQICGATHTVIAVAPTFSNEEVRHFTQHHPVELVHGVRDTLGQAKLALVVSGTATLEAALAGVPSVVVYKTDRLTWEVGRRLVNMKQIAMPNILLTKEGHTPIFPELLQEQTTPDRIVKAARQVLETRTQLTHATAILRDLLKPPPPQTEPAARAAEVLVRRFLLDQ